MAETTRKRKGEIVRAVFAVLAKQPEGMQAQKVIAAVRQALVLSEYEKGEYESTPGRSRFDLIVRFSTIGPVKAGWMTKSKSGTWTITEAGLAAWHKYPDPIDLMREADRLYRVWKKTKVDLPPGETDEDEETPAATSVATLEEARENAWNEVRAYLHTMSPYDFQALVAALLGAMGYHVVYVAPPGPDRGIDILAYIDPLGATGPRIKVQVKRHTTDKRIAVGDVRAFIAVLSDRDIGLFVSANGFTSEAYTEARMLESRRLTLVDLEALFELWTDHYDRLALADRQLLPLQPVYFLSPED